MSPPLPPPPNLPPHALWLDTELQEAPRPPAGGELLVALPYPGLTPHRWSLRTTAAATVVASRRIAATTGAAGAGGHQEITLHLAAPPEELVFDLAVGTDPPAFSRRLHFSV